MNEDLGTIAEQDTYGYLRGTRELPRNLEHERTEFLKAVQRAEAAGHRGQNAFIKVK